MDNEHIDRLSNIMCEAIDKAYDLDVRDELDIDDMMDYMQQESVVAHILLDGQKIDFSLCNPDESQYILSIVPLNGCNNLDLVDDYIDAFLNSYEGEMFDVNTAVETEDDHLILVSNFFADSDDEAINIVCNILCAVAPNFRSEELSALLGLFR